VICRLQHHAARPRPARAPREPGHIGQNDGDRVPMSPLRKRRCASAISLVVLMQNGPPNTTGLPMGVPAQRNLHLVSK
jgi:hypothetical protein